MPDPAELLPVLYEASADKEQWPVFLQKLTEQVRASAADLVSLDHTANRCSLGDSFGVDPEGKAVYQSYYGKIDTFFACAQKKGLTYPGCVTPSQAIVSSSDLFRTEFGNDFLLRFSMFYVCFSLFGEGSRASGVLSLIRGKEGQPFDEPELRTLRFLGPHLQRAIQLGERFNQLKAESEAKQEVLDQIGLGVVFLDGRGKVIGSNEAAANILAKQDGLAVRHGRLEAADPERNRSFQAAIFNACRTGAGHANATGAGLLIPRRPPAKPLQLVIGPACARMPRLPSCPTAIVFIHDLSNRIRPKQELLSSLYGLSPAESRLACLMLDGKSAEEISGVLHVSKNTIKTQVRSVFSKTNSRRQSELVRVLMYLPTESGQRGAASSSGSTGPRQPHVG